MALMPEDDEIAIIRDASWLPGETVSIKTYAGDGITRRIRDALVVIQRDGDAGQPGGISYNTGAAALLKLQYAITGWTLLYARSKKPIPFTPANIDRLPTSYADFILDEINTAWAAWDAVPGGGSDPEKEERFPPSADAGDGGRPAAGTG